MRVRWTLPAVLALLALTIVPSAHAGVLVSSATDCASQTPEQPFLRWGDRASYVLAPGGSFEPGETGWALRGSASVGSGNEPFTVHGAGESSSLVLAAGGSATSPAQCVGLDHPTLRLFTRGGSLLSALRVEVLFETSVGAVVAAPVGVVTAGGWAPTLAFPVVANLLPLLPNERTAVAFRFTALGGDWRIDDVYVDPRNRR
jgi:hypothetical protein